MTNALAFSNNDIAVIAWAYDEKIEGCLGFAIFRGDIHAGAWVALPALARFAESESDGNETTEQAPVQKYWWKDLGARRGGLFQYKIVPMGGRPGALEPLGGVEPLLTNPVAITPDRGQFKAYFNRGILATQAVVQALGTPSADRLMRHISDPKDKLRLMLEGQLQDALTLLLDEIDTSGGEIRAALYELNDPDGLEKRLQASDGEGSPKTRAVILGNETVGADAKTGTPADPDKFSADRQALKDAGAPVIDRILPSGHIPHNKFMVLKENDTPTKVLTGSTNWTMNALAAQTNNALIVESPAIAALYSAYWDELERDTGSATRGDEAWQGPTLRAWVQQHNAAMLQNPVMIEDHKTTAQVFFSPNTKKAIARPPKEHPVDVDYLAELIGQAETAVLFLAFEPGANSILDAAGRALKAKPTLFVRGALTSAANALNFKAALEGDEETAPEGRGKRPTVATIGDNAGAAKPEPDYRVIPATAVNAHDAFGAWAAELNKAGFAIIHDKILVIDPFSDKCVVVTGSHNLGYRASHNNDENMIVVRGHRSLAEAYACHVLDVYDHYAWRWWLAKDSSRFGKPLAETDDWQDRYLKGAKVVSPELNFWLSSSSSVDAHAASPAPLAQSGRKAKTRSDPAPRSVRQTVAD
ncbi:MAG TPA: phospholipase D-like domain-containing protein [Methylocystis sp.]|nr:phospholipase D-like domain-containing protein [Methylocystis sp.]